MFNRKVRTGPLDNFNGLHEEPQDTTPTDSGVATPRAAGTPVRASATLKPLAPGPRPDGSRIEHYRKHEAWSKRRWAWEFLKRNVSFRAACERIVDMPEGPARGEAEQEACEKFGLFSYRHYNADYAKPYPNFALGRVRSWTQIDHAGYDVSDVPTVLKNGQVLMLFDLNHALVNTRALSGQIAHARRKLERRLAILSSSSSTVPASPKPKTDHFVVCLRMLDAKASGMTAAAIARMLFPDETCHLDKDEARELFKSRFRPANDLVRGGYREVASAYYDSY